ncbi:Sec34-like family-domain-containing protein [Phlebopus sp. FC_14]|nr:Sec34-like family-domain-containing protein [Phlebopus sp. FC_14]
MSAVRPTTQRRTATPVLPAQQQRPQITLEEWEARAPLSDAALKSVAAVQAASENIPLPLKFSVEEAESSRPSTPNLRAKVGPGSRSPTPIPAATRSHPSHALDPKQPIQTPQQFYDWFAQIDRSVAHSQEAHFRAHVAMVSKHLDTADMLIEQIDEVEREVDGMFEGWRRVEEGGQSLKGACERLLEERDKLLALTDEIDTRLEYFQELEHATRLLNHPGDSLVLQTDFLYMVERVDICIEYLKAHRYFKEAEVYLLRFQQCMTRAMTLIKMFFVGSLRALTTDVSRRLSEKDVSATAQMHLLYTRFRSVAPQLAPLLGELERRAAAHPEELSALLSECHAAYFSARKNILVGRLTEEIRGLDPSNTGLVELTNAGCSYLKQLCIDEFDLYRHFFNTGEDQLYSYLENLCDYLYDDLRPRILHETRLTTLCEVCTVLQALMVLDVVELPEEPPDELNMDLDHPKRKGLGKLHISHLLQMVLQDAQTRLFFKAQSVIQSEVRYYIPQPQDLAYPDKLVAARKPVSQFDIKEKESFSRLFQLSSLDKKETWYLTLQKTVWVLSQLHDFVKPAIFEDIAQEAVSFCRQSLVSSSSIIGQRSPPTSALDGELFLARHLLILKEVANNLDFVQKDTQPATDMGGMTDTLASIVNKTTALLPDALFASLGMPRGHESITDARHDIDQDLKRTCQNVISLCSKPSCEPLREWVDRVRAFNTSRAAPPISDQPTPLLTELDWARESAAVDLHKKFVEACERDLRASVTRLRLYLEDDRTVSILLTHIKEAVVDGYMGYRDVVWNMYAGALKSIVFSEERLREKLSIICDS